MWFPIKNKNSFLFFFFLLFNFMLNGQDTKKIGKYVAADTSLAIALVKEGIVLANTNKWDSVLIKTEQAKEIFQQTVGENFEIVGDLYFCESRFYYYQADYKKGLELSTNSMDIYNAVSIMDSTKVANIVDFIGVNYEGAGQYENALLYAKKALSIRSRIVDIDELQVADSYGSISAFYLNLGKVDSALIVGKQAMLIYENNEIGKATVKLAHIYNNRGRCYDNKVDFAKAIYYHEKALNLLKSLVDEVDENIASTYMDLGVIYERMGEIDKGLRFKLKSTGIRRALLGEDHPFMAYAYNNLGTSYFSKGDYTTGIKYYEIAKPSLTESLGKEHPYVGLVNMGLGLCYQGLGEEDKAISFHEISKDILLAAYGADHPYAAMCYNNLAVCYTDKGNYDEAIRLHEKSLEIRHKTYGDQHVEVADSKAMIGIVYGKKKEYERAMDYFSKAYYSYGITTPNVFTKVEKPSAVIEVLNEEGLLYRDWYYTTNNEMMLELSNKAFVKMLNAIDYQLKVTGQSDISNIAKFTFPFYENAIQGNYIASKISNELEHQEKMFLLAENSKSIRLYQSLQESKALKFADIPESLLEQEANLRVDITYYDKKRQEEYSKGYTETDSTVLVFSSKLFNLNEQYEALKNKLESNYPNYYKLKYDRSILSLAEIQNELLTEKQTLLEYFVGDSSIFAFIVQPENFEVLEIKKDFPLEEWVKDFQEGIYGAYGNEDFTTKQYGETLKQYIDVAPKLYNRLIDPIKNLLTEEVIIIPDGVLGYVSFEALLKAKPERVANFNSYPFFIKDHRLSYCYSAKLLKEMKEKKHRQKPEKSLIAFAPFYEGSYEKLNELFSAELDTTLTMVGLLELDDVAIRKTLTALPHSGEEVLAASKIWNGDHLLNKAATEDQFNALVSNYRIVHLSTHGVADSRVGDYSYLAFAEQKDNIENEYLYVRDLYNVHLNADLVVLSACETATGELQRGEGIISLARAFAYAGAKSILTTLWVVDDAATKDLTKAFYLQLRKGNPKDLALQKAKLQVLNGADNKRKHPFFWAAMIGVGDMSELKK